jgi:hypothetical protein
MFRDFSRLLDSDNQCLTVEPAEDHADMTAVTVSATYSRPLNTADINLLPAL